MKLKIIDYKSIATNMIRLLASSLARLLNFNRGSRAELASYATYGLHVHLEQMGRPMHPVIHTVRISCEGGLL